MHTRQRQGFSLVELMVVIGIIALLVAIVLPAVNVARTKAKVAATKVTIASAETGLEAFRADHAIGGEYPPSMSLGIPGGMCKSPYDNDEMRIQGAYMLAWALVGADYLGTPGFIDTNGNGIWEDNTGSGDVNVDLYAIVSGSQPRFPRSGPFIDKDKLKFPTRQGGEFVIDALPTNPVLDSTCILDAFDQPILYYRANPGQSEMAGGHPRLSPGIYNWYDNGFITGMDTSTPGIDLGAGLNHPMRTRGAPPSGAVVGSAPTPKGSFAYQVWDPSVTAAWRPHRADSYILLSAGPDGLYGTADDVANFEINK
jgi:prepilin-type N-terminal cleavage/methylation domain-containing protein